MAQPEMMAIGDSLHNGVRSMTIDRDLAKWSIPAQVANALGIPFAIPDYPRNVVVELERWLRAFPDIGFIERDVADNVQFWLTQPRSPSGLTEFDNIAIASTNFDEMTTRSWRTAQFEIDRLVGQYGANIGKLGAQMADLYFAFNTRFILNPSGDPATPAETPMQTVARRKPKRLLVSIGSNDGLWEICFDASPNGFGAGAFTALRNFFAALRALPPEVEHIYFNALALPSTVSNLMPIPDYAENHKPPPGTYYANYENRFGLTYGTLDAAGMKLVDDRIAQANAAIRAEAQKDPRIHIVPIDEMLKKYDRKHDAAASVVVSAGGKTFSNVMLEAGPWPLPSFRTGGLQGLDGMHPTIVGYALMAREALESIRQHEGVVAPAPNLDAAYSSDTLLKAVPRAWSIVLWLWRDIRRAQFLPAGPQPQGLEESATKGLMRAVHFKTN